MQDAMAYPDVFELFSAGSLSSSSRSVNVSEKIHNNIKVWAGQEAERGGGVSREALEKVFRVQAGMMLDGRAPVMEYFYFEPRCVVGFFPFLF